MAFLQIPSVRIEGISACVPTQKSSDTHYSHLFATEEYAKFKKLTGITSVRVANESCTTSDMCFMAAQKLLSEMNISPDEIDLLIFVSQTPDYITPMTSCILQDKLKLPKSCIAFDVTSGCSGYTQGLSIASSMLSTGSLRRVLLLAGDTIHGISKNDKITYPLFGAAGSATLLSHDPSAEDIYIESGTDGSGYKAIIIPDGGTRHPFTESSLVEHKIAEGVARSSSQLILDGQKVFSFAISEVPDSIERLYKHFGLDISATDYFIFHQANRLILETIADVLDISTGKVLFSLDEFGNTSSASIPLTFVSRVGSIHKPTHICLCGFGVGLSWASMYLTTDKIHCCKLIEI